MKNLNSILKRIDSHDNAVYLETNRYDKDNKTTLLFLKPKKIITCVDGRNLKQKIEEIEKEISKGGYAAGFFSYEAGYFFEEALSGKRKYKFPLLWFGIFKKPLIIKRSLKEPLRTPEVFLEETSFNINFKRYQADIKKIKKHIEKGNVYQINYTFKDRFNYPGNWLDLYLSLRNSQKVSYSGIIKFNNHVVLSFSPELFFRRAKNIIETRPMKGTYKRGKDIKEDKYNMLKLKNSTKDRSENLMIVDLLRNDFGRISDAGSVKTQELFKVEKYKTLFQMISIVRGKLKKDISLYELFESIFPCGSVTGAPKIRAMQIIRNLEKEPRGIYTGSIGYLTPEKEAVFNVAIRTLVLDTDKKKAEMGIGSGIVYDSKVKNEFKECLLKVDFTKKALSDFRLIETMLVKKNRKIYLLAAHLKRLKKSLNYFNFCYNESVIKNKLQKYLKKLNNSKIYKLKLLISKDGSLIISHSPIKESHHKGLKVVISGKRSNSDNIFLYHKTTNRSFYDNEYKKAMEKGLTEVLFLNERSQVAEGAISNIIIKKDNCYYTPPANCGLLSGVYRQQLINKKNFPLKEKILYKQDLLRANKIFICNSVRGLREVKLISGY